MLLRLPCGDAPVSFIDARDIAELAAVTLWRPGHGGRAYDLYGPESPNYGQATAAVARAFSLSARYEDVPEASYRAQIGTSASAERVLNLYRYYRSGAAAGPAIDLVPLLGRPAHTLADFGTAYRSTFAG